MTEKLTDMPNAFDEGYKQGHNHGQMIEREACAKVLLREIVNLEDLIETHDDASEVERFTDRIEALDEMIFVIRKRGA